MITRRRRRRRPPAAGGAADRRRDPDARGRRPRRAASRDATGVNNDPMRQPDARLRALNSEPDRRAARGGVLHQGRHDAPDEMYIVGAHMDGHGWGEAANDDGSGTALVMELARIFSTPDVVTDDRSALRSGTTRRPA